MYLFNKYTYIVEVIQSTTESKVEKYGLGNQKTLEWFLIY